MSQPYIETDQTTLSRTQLSTGAAILGVISLLLTLLMDKRFLEAALVPHGEIESQTIKLVLACSQLLCLVLAAYCFVKRPLVDLKNLALVTVGICLSFAVAETALWWIDKPQQRVSGWKSNVLKSGLNQLGFRGQAINYSAEDFVIVLVGDSQVEAGACAYGWMPERRLQHYLGSNGKHVKVFTVAAHGYGQSQQLLALREYYARFRADLVVVWLTPGNDVVDNIWPTHLRGSSRAPQPAFRLEDGELRGPTEQILEPITFSRSRILSYLLEQSALANRDHDWERFLPGPYAPMAHHDGPVTERDYPYRFSYFVTKYALDSDRSSFSLLLTPPSPRILYGLELTHRLLKEIEALARQQGSGLVLFTTSPAHEKIITGEYVEKRFGKYYTVSEEQYQTNIGHITRDFEYHHILVNLREWAYGPEDGHFNEHAVDEAMARLAAKLLPDIR